MADTEEPQYTTLAERIAALNKNKTFAANGPASAKPARPAPPPPPSRTQSGLGASNTAKSATPAVPARPTKGNPPPLPRRDTQTSLNGQDAARPPLPSRKSSTQQPPALPQRQNSSQPNGLLNVRRDSTSSEISQNSTRSSKSAGQSSWSTASQNSTSSAPRKLPPTQPHEAQKPASTPSLPPRLPARGTKQDAAPTRPRIMGFGSSQAPEPGTNGQNSTQNGINKQRDAEGPPPVPTATRPSAVQIKEATSRTAQPAPALNNCFACRDWSAPDAVAAQHPRESLPSHDAIGYLAHNLCSPFPSYSDKARAIFTWFHHNIAYDTGSFFGKSIQYHDGQSTIRRGLAVCSGYAETYMEIAKRAGLECVVVNGHCKGFGYTALKDGEPLPKEDPSGHAWNAVRIDGGGWKLVDPCWGAGNVDGATQSFNKVFAPHHFHVSNEEFGARHWPEDKRLQYREDGRIVGWEEYYRGRASGEPVTVFSNASDEGIDEFSVEPANKNLQVYSGQVLRFQFHKVCPHWKSERHGLGKAPLFVLNIHGLDGRKDDMVPFETDGYWHWLDVNARDLGAPGQKVEVTQISTVDNKDARGITAREFLAARGKKSMSFAFLTQWILK